MARKTRQRESEAGRKWLIDKGQLFQVPHLSSVAEPEEPL